MKNPIQKSLASLLIVSILFLCCVSANSQTVETNENMKLYFFKCSVSDDLYGASPNKDGNPLPTPGGGQWLPIDILDSNHPEAIVGFDSNVAHTEIAKYGCHWFTTKDQGIFIGVMKNLQNWLKNNENKLTDLL